MTLTKSLLCAISTLTLATGAAFASEDSAPLSSLETTDEAYFAQSEPTMTDPEEVYYVVPVEVAEIEEVAQIEEIWLLPSGDSEMPRG